MDRILVAFLLGFALARIGVAQSYSAVHGFESAGSYRGLILASDGYFYGASSTGGSNGVGFVFRMDTDGNNFSIIHTFSFGPDIFPSGALLEGSDGYLYGTCTGAAFGPGAVFRISKTSADYSVIHVFGPFESGIIARGLVQADDGYLYGPLFVGGPGGFGGIFKLDTAGSVYSVIHNFDGTDGAHPSATLTQGSDGLLYGVSGGDLGAGNHGNVFRLDTSGGNFEVVHTFSGGDGEAPQGSLVEVAGVLYGTTSSGGATGLGVLYKVGPDGSDFSALHDFGGADGQAPVAALVLATDGFLHGTASGGGVNGLGAVFKVQTDGNGFAVTHSFASSEGAGPTTPLIETAGFLYGATGGVEAGTVFRLGTSGGSFSNVHANVTGANPNGALIQDSGGHFYGTAASGGPMGSGVVFKLDALGQASAIHQFNASDGWRPTSPLALAPDEHLYGATANGGATASGTVFRLDTAGNDFSVLYEFTGAEGREPAGGLILGDDGSLYGVSGGCGGLGCGTVYKLDTDGQNFEVIHDFSAAEGGFSPAATLLQASDGFLYGTTLSGGSAGDGVVFRLDTSGGNFSVIHDFVQTDGSAPRSALIEDADGFLYGTTSAGGTGGGCDVDGCGTVFRLDASGNNFSVIHNFTGVEGSDSAGGVIQATDGLLYGTLSQAACFSSAGAGVIFRIATDGSGFEIFHRFIGPDGANPSGSLLEGADGALYGTSTNGAPLQGGVVFRVDLDVPFLGTSLTPSSGPADGGTSVTISGVGFQIGALVTIGGKAATGVQVNGSAEIIATTPALSPGTLNDVLITNTDSTLATMPHAWLADFTDVAQGDIFHDSVAKIFRNGITAGCGSGEYCRDNSVTRAQMAVFLLKAEHGSCFQPPPCTGVFGDVECTPAPSFAVNWIEQLAAEGITGGCGGDNYCPDAPVTRAQMAVFLLKGEHGSSYTPPACTGVFADVACPSLFADWIEQLAAEQITGGCGGGNYCPDAASTRGQMAVFLTKAFL